MLVQSARCTDTPLPDRDEANDWIAGHRGTTAGDPDEHVLHALDDDRGPGSPCRCRGRGGARRSSSSSDLGVEQAMEPIHDRRGAAPSRRRLPPAERRGRSCPVRWRCPTDSRRERWPPSPRPSLRRAVPICSRPSASACSRRSRRKKALILDLARDVRTKFSQSMLGPASTALEVMTSTMSPDSSRVERGKQAPVDPYPDASVADLGVDGIGEVDRGRRRVAAS